MRVIYWLITAPLLAFSVSFAISNRGDVSLSLLPLPFEITMPVAAVGLLAMLFGAIIGMLMTWLGCHKIRNRARVAERTADIKAREVANLNEELRRTKVAQSTTIVSQSTEQKALSKY